MTYFQVQFAKQTQMTFGTKRALTVFTVLLYVLFILIKVGAGNFDVSRLIIAGDRFVNESALTHPIYVLKHSDGYDGQFYYRLALNPLTHERIQYGITLDHPEVRSQRILYPATVWLLSLGNAYLIPYFLVILNIASLGVICWVSLLLCEQLGVRPEFGLLIPFYPGFVLSLVRDTAEIYAVLFAMCAVYAALNRKHVPAAMLAVAAILVRETTLFYLAGFGVAILLASIKRRKVDPSLWFYLVPPAVLILWHLILLHAWGTLPLSKLSSDDFTFPPLVDFFQAGSIAFHDFTSKGHLLRHAYNALSLIAVAAFVLTVTWNIASRKVRHPSLVYSWGFYFTLLLFFSIAIWTEPFGYLRILCDLYVLGCLTLISSRHDTILRNLLYSVTPLWLITCIYAL